jgi:hypothetical protein
MKNSTTKKFAKSIIKLINDYKLTIATDFNQFEIKVKEIDLEVFGNDKEYSGETKNKIFFTYDNHYKHNRGESMRVGHVHHAHRGMDDRGFVKGVATDLQGYLVLRSAAFYDRKINTSLPRIRKSKYSEAYKAECEAMIIQANKSLTEFISRKKESLNDDLFELTNMNLLNYVEIL